MADDDLNDRADRTQPTAEVQRGHLPDLRAPLIPFALAWPVMVAALFAIFLKTEANPEGVGPFAVAAGLSLLGAWAVARCFVQLPEPQRRQGWLRSIVVWWVVYELTRRAALQLVPDASTIGHLERYFIAPAVAALVVAIGAAARLKPPVSIVAAVSFALLVLGGLGDGLGREPVRVVSAAGVAQLQRASASGDAVVMRGEAFAPTTGFGVPARPAIQNVAAATLCRRAVGRFTRRTALGVHGRALRFRADVCWNDAGRPVSAVFDAQWRAGWESTTPHPVRLESLAASNAVSRIGDDGQSFGGISRFYDDEGVRAAADETRTTSGAAVYSRDGRFPSTTTRSQPQSSNVAMRVSDDGQAVAFEVALETVDPLVRGRRDQGGLADNEPDTNARLFSLRTRPGYVVDVVNVHVSRSQGGGGSLLRTTANGAFRGRPDGDGD